MPSLSQLNDRFNADGAIRFGSGNGGLTRALLQSNGAEAHLYLHGAHLTHYRPAGGRDVLFMSHQSHFEPGKPIRGGVPICFPWFSNIHEPPHGYARLQEWTVDSARRDGDAVELALALDATPAQSPHWPHTARVRFIVRLAATLTMTLEVTNTSNTPIHFAEALHTYLAVGDVRQARLHGLEGAAYLDKTQGGRSAHQPDQPLAFSQCIDRVYPDTQATCIVEDPLWHRRIEVAKTSSRATVVWNPWIERARQMEDFDDDRWPEMLCVETANVGPAAITLPPGQTHTMTATLRVE